MFGIDATSTGDPAALKKAGVKFVCRYLSTPGNSKNLSGMETKRLTKAGLGIVTVFETTANRALQGADAGRQDALSVVQQLPGIGAPKTAPVYFAVDFDASPTQQNVISSYLGGAASVLTKDRTGVYGSYYTVKRALDARVCKYGWQTYAWSGGQWYPGAHIRQYLNAQTLAGLWVDFDAAMKADYGQWRRPRVRLPKLAVSYAVAAYDTQGKLVRAWTTRYPGLSLVRWNVALRRPARISVRRINV